MIMVIFDREQDVFDMHIETGPLAIFQGRTVPQGLLTCRLGGGRSARSGSPPRSVDRVAFPTSTSAAASERMGRWTIFDKRHWPGDAFADHLGFALRHKTIDLLIFERRLCHSCHKQI